LKKEIDAEYFVAVTRPPTVYRGYPFQVEVGLAYGGNLNPNTTAHLYRFANKVPLLYHQRGCAMTRAVEEVDWRRYGLQQSGGMPTGPLVVFVHFASVWVPFTSEGKEAIANYPEIIKEIKLSMQDAGRQLAKFVRQKKRTKQRQLRRRLFERYIPEVAEALSELTDKNQKTIAKKLEDVMKKDKEISMDAQPEEKPEEKQEAKEEKEEEKTEEEVEKGGS
jgi:DNA topoisomerase-6 subunit B